MEEQEFYAREQTLRDNGFDSSQIATALALMRRTFGALRSGRESAVRVEIENARREPWFAAIDSPVTMYAHFSTETKAALRAMISFDALPLWSDIRVPALVTFGSKDKIVPTLRSAPLIESALRLAPVRDVTIQVFPEAGHSMQLEPDAGKTNPPGYPEQFWRSMASWLTARVR